VESESVTRELWGHPDIAGLENGRSDSGAVAEGQAHRHDPGLLTPQGNGDEQSGAPIGI
jgi:hypothetical protein